MNNTSPDTIKFFSFKTIVKIIGVIIIFLFGYIFIFSGSKPKQEIQNTVKEKTTPVITFGKFQPESSREILGTIISSKDVDIVSQTAGTITQTFVEIGDGVKKGQLLAQFQTSNNAGALSYQNSLQSMEVAQSSAQNMIDSAQSALNTAKLEAQKTKTANEQNRSQLFNTLITATQNADTTISNIIDWTDNTFGASTKYEYRFDAVGRKIGNNDSIQTEEIRSTLRNIMAKQKKLKNFYEGDDVISFSYSRLGILENLKSFLHDMNDLISVTPSIDGFSDANRTAYQTQAEGFASSVNGILLTLESNLETAQTVDKQIELSLTSAADRVQNAEAALELTKSSAQSQIVGAENQIRSTEVLQNNTEVRAPFDGKITAKMISNFDQIGLGQKLFTLVSQDTPPRIVGSVTQDDLQRLLGQNSIKIGFENGQTYTIQKSFLSTKVDSQTQKIQVEFAFDNFPKNVLIGSLAHILIPLEKGISNLVPVSSISFEPDGAEVLIVNNQNIAERRKIKYDKIISDSVEISDGLIPEDRIVQFRNQVNAGDKIKNQ